MTVLTHRRQVDFPVLVAKVIVEKHKLTVFRTDYLQDSIDSVLSSVDASLTSVRWLIGQMFVCVDFAS